MRPDSLRLCLILTVLYILLALVDHPQAAAQRYGVQLDGIGSSAVAGIFNEWNPAYRNARDDVALQYSTVGPAAALNIYNQGEADFVVLDRALPPELLVEYGSLVQIPVVGQAVVMAYHISSLDPTDPPLIVDGSTLGLIWSGDIAMWNDSRIKDLNPDIANKLPASSIKLGYYEEDIFSFVELVKQALATLSPEFKAALAAANNTWANMAPAQRGTAVDLHSNVAADRFNWVQSTANSMTYATYADASAFGLPVMNMRNKEGQEVSANLDSIQSAMDAFDAEFDKKGIAIDIIDASGNSSWPIAFMSFLAIKPNLTAADCSSVNELLNFLAWTQTNDNAAELAEEEHLAPITLVLKDEFFHMLGDIQCNGEQAYSSKHLLGIGASLPVLTSWLVTWSSENSQIKLFASTSMEAREQLENDQVDVGAVIDGLAEEIEDVTLLPVLAFALVPTYHIPELPDTEIVLDFETIAGIYLNQITMWSDPRIKNLNPDIEDQLPVKEIVVVTESEESEVTYLFTSLLSATVKAFSDQIGVSYHAAFPFQSESNRSVEISGGDALSGIKSTPYSFGWWFDFESSKLHELERAAIKLADGSIARPTRESFLNALNTLDVELSDFSKLLLGEGSWPLLGFGSYVYKQTDFEDCTLAAALADYFLWIAEDPRAQRIASNRAGQLPATLVPGVRALLLDQLKRFTCDGDPVSSVSNCINDGEICSGAGVCTDNACLCDPNREGEYCEKQASSSEDVLAIALGVIIPTVAIILVVLIVCLIILAVAFKRKGRENNEWEINFDELELGEQLGAGGYGEVHKAMWKGTEVAVKVIASERVTKEMEKSFKDEVRVMTALRHPNVVLFMAASTKAPKMCIVMEYMSLGSLYELLHNELISDSIPHLLKIKMAYQASKGMHFLHSSGIVHRDLKSLNLLLDGKWNVKVSDFGLTKFREDMNKNKVQGGNDIAGSVHWTAPEVLNESPDVDYVLADVYSFGIVLWELLTREQPYAGLSPAAVAVAVIRDGIRPKIPDSVELLANKNHEIEYIELIKACWHVDPTIRPTFLEIMTRLSAMNGDSSTGMLSSKTSTSTSTPTSSSSGATAEEGMAKPIKVPKSTYSSWALPSSVHSATSSSSSQASKVSAAVAEGAGIRAPEGEMTIVFTDITRAASLWEFNAEAMRDATLLHNAALRSALKKHRGYEVVFMKDRNSGEGSFCMAFQHTTDAVAWCAEVQKALLDVSWPEALLEHPGAAEEWGNTDDRVIFKGLRVRMGIHVGTPKMLRDPMTRRVEYIGPVVNAAARITALTHGGQVVLSHTAYANIRSDPVFGEPTAEENKKHNKRLVYLGKFEIPDTPNAPLYELKVPGLEARFFGDVDYSESNSTDDNSSKTPRSKGKHRISTSNLDYNEDDGRKQVGDGMMFKEDNYLASANLCRWIINFSEIQVGKQIGLGSYGVVYRGRWKGVDVAVKRFIKQKLDERRMLEFRAEMAFLSELHHPNIVLFIGACVKRPNLCIVTEFMKQGSLKDILSTTTIKLGWQQKLQLLRSAALGINYLHSLHPVIVHRDLKPSNLLVDENWNVKVADFGFARIKEENATMTRCGTPCWTAPEILRGEKYDESADVFSFGIIMWQVLTRKEPYAGRNFMGVSLDVLEGKRPQIPNDTPPEFRKTMKKCWHASADRRPSMENVVSFLSKLTGDDAAESAI